MLHTAIQTLHTAIQTLHTAIQTLHTAIQTLHTAIQTLHIAIQTLHTAIQTLHTAIQTLHTAIQTLHTALYIPTYALGDASFISTGMCTANHSLCMCVFLTSSSSAGYIWCLPILTGNISTPRYQKTILLQTSSMFQDRVYT